MFPDPSTTRIVHDTMIAEELARQNPDLRAVDRAAPVRLPAIRRGTSRALVGLADRIAPERAACATGDTFGVSRLGEPGVRSA